MNSKIKNQLKEYLHMKHLFSILTFSVFALFISCNSSNKSNPDEIYEYVEETAELNDFLKQKIGDWAEEGVICYGVVVLIDSDGTAKDGAPVKSRILRIKSDSIKMKSLEDINLSEFSGCDKIGISRGEKWWETEGDLFNSLEEAEAFLSKLNFDKE